MHVNKMKDEYFANNMVTYIEKKIAKKFSPDSIIMILKI